MADFNKAIDIVLMFEGGYVNDPDDPGAETKYGISKKAYPNLDIKELTLVQAKEIYKKDYWDRIQGDNIPDQFIANLLLDSAVNLGVKKAVKLAQEILGVKVDGILGKETMYMLKLYDPYLLFNKYKLSRINYYTELCNRNHNLKKYLLGWINRVLKV